MRKDEREEKEADARVINKREEEKGRKSKMHTVKKACQKRNYEEVKYQLNDSVIL